ncbi:MAG: DUF4446 family protein [Firmicutes bacterium]|nr:DUF4446 family protein [Bacillota bacterium]
MNEFVLQNAGTIFIALIAVIIILAVVCFVLFNKMKLLQEKYIRFMGSGRKNHSLESLIMDYAGDMKRLKEHYRALAEKIREIDGNLALCIRKVGVVRYNPFDEMGGNLSFAAAFLDERDNGIVLNGIHGREGSFTYAKPVEAGKSRYVLSREEEQAIREARESVKDTPVGTIKLERPVRIYKVKKYRSRIEAEERNG